MCPNLLLYFIQMFALVTGASSGMGLQYATQLARDYHYDILLVSNQQQELLSAASDIHDNYHVQTDTLYIDLSQQDAAEKVYAYCCEKNYEIDVLINNAGLLIFEPLSNVSMKKLEVMLMVHMVTLTKLTKLISTDMIARSHGYILNMSSMTAWMTMPGIQCYNATKGYVLNFSKALWYELERHGIHVLAVTPGSIDTPLLPFPDKFAKLLRVTKITMKPEKLVKKALYVLLNTKRKRCMPGAWNYIIVPIINHLPDWVVFTAMRLLPQFK